MYIYMIKNIINNKVYIGQTKRHYKKRFSDHINHLKKNKHGNCHLQAAWNKYGQDAFEFIIVDKVVFQTGLNNLETFWISFYKANDSEYGYNLTTGGESPTINAESIKKISEALKGKPTWNKGLKGICKAWNKGIKLGPQSKELIEKRAKAISASVKGKNNHRFGRKAYNAKQIMCNETKQIFNSIKEASEYFDGRREHLRDHLKGKQYRNKFKGYTFMELKGNN